MHFSKPCAYSMKFEYQKKKRENNMDPTLLLNDNASSQENIMKDVLLLTNNVKPKVIQSPIKTIILKDTQSLSMYEDCNTTKENIETMKGETLYLEPLVTHNKGKYYLE
jgi:hypothetical protein